MYRTIMMFPPTVIPWQPVAPPVPYVYHEIPVGYYCKFLSVLLTVAESIKPDFTVLLGFWDM